jgi:hypothetical protein
MDPYTPESENPESANDEYVLGPNDLEPVVINPYHFVLLHIATFGIYSIYWNYKAWQYFKEKEKSDIWPFARSVFFIFFGIEFFARIEAYCKQYNHKVSYNPALLWILALGINFLGLLPIPYSLIGVVWFIPFVPAVRELNFYFTGNKNGYINDKLNNQQLMFIVIGVIYWLLVIASLYVGVDPKVANN